MPKVVEDVGDSRSESCRSGHLRTELVSWSLSSFAVGVVQVRASQGRRGRDTGSYVDRGERREVRAWAARSVKRLRLRDTIRLLNSAAPS